MSIDFAHIHLHTDFSILDGYGRVSSYTKKAKQCGIKHFCVTDHGMAASYPQMVEECAKHELNAVFGSEIYVNNYGHLIPEYKNLTDEEKRLVRRSDHLVLLAKNNQGYDNVVKLVSDGWINGFYYKPRVSWDMVKQYSEGLICSSACLGSILSQLIMKGKLKEAVDHVCEARELWGEDYFIELQMIKMEEQDTMNQVLIKMADKYDIPLVMTNDVHYCEQFESYNQRILLLLNSKGTINDPGNALEFHTNQLWYKTPDEMEQTWEESYRDTIPEAEFKEACANTVRICERCDVKIDTSSKFPEIPGAEDIILQQCVSSMKTMGLYEDKEYRARFLKEFDLIRDKGYCSYFLCAKKIVDYAMSIDKIKSPGRGSSGGSLVCYLLGITQVDPIKHDLLFERFLSPSRGGKFAKLQFSDKAKIS